MRDEPLRPEGAARLYSVARALTGALTAPDVAAAVFDQALVGLGARGVGLWLMDSLGKSVRFAGGVGPGVPDGSSAMPIGSDVPIAEVMRTGRIVVSGRPSRWASGADTAPAVTGGPEVTAVLPLTTAGRPLGCLHITYPEGTEPAEVDVVFLSRLSELCAAALDRAQLHDSERDRQALLLDASEAVAAAGSFADGLERLAAVAVPRLADLCLIDVIERPGEVQRMVALHADPEAAPLVAELYRQYAPDPSGQHPAARAMATRHPMWAPDIPDELLRSVTLDEHHLELVRQLRFSSYMSVPLISGAEVLGAITLVSSGSGRHFDRDDLALAENLAGRVAGVVAAARRLEREHELAHILQQLLLPASLPSVSGVQLAARYLTAHPEAEAGGDFYDAVVLADGRLVFVIGDVEGHDTLAAATMGQLRSALRALAVEHGCPGLVIDELRSSWELLGFSRMATCVVGRLDPADGSVELTSAGHLPALVACGDGAIRTLAESQAPPLGAPAARSPIERFTLEHGDTLFLYTDGLVERRKHPIDEQVSELRASLSSVHHLGADELSAEVVRRFAGGDQRADDVAVLALRRTAPTPRP